MRAAGGCIKASVVETQGNIEQTDIASAEPENDTADQAPAVMQGDFAEQIAMGEFGIDGHGRFSRRRAAGIRRYAP